jgi:hypothetical protein
MDDLVLTTLERRVLVVVRDSLQADFESVNLAIRHLLENALREVASATKGDIDAMCSRMKRIEVELDGLDDRLCDLDHRVKYLEHR